MSTVYSYNILKVLVYGQILLWNKFSDILTTVLCADNKKLPHILLVC